MKIAALSDIHGNLPEIDPCDVVCICGDIVPLFIQRDMQQSQLWLKDNFFYWVSKLPCDRVIIIGGNHDWIFQHLGNQGMQKLILDSGLEFKLVYLNNNLYIYNNLSFYGCPNVHGLPGWAFNTQFPSEIYNKIPDCTILLTHQPPAIGEVGRSLTETFDWGSKYLRDAITNKDIKYMFCGHVHDGDHRELLFGNTYIRNVSFKDNDYIPAYPITYLNISENGPETNPTEGENPSDIS